MLPLIISNYSKTNTEIHVNKDLNRDFRTKWTNQFEPDVQEPV